MSIQHPTLAAGRWQSFSFLEQMANIGGEVERAMIWKNKNNHEYSDRAFERSLELLSFTLDDPRNLNRAKELTRLHEILVDFFQGSNQFGSSDDILRRYFGAFAFAARRDR